MPEHLRALVVILTIASLVFWLAERPMTAAAMQVADYRGRRNLWFAVTLAAFLSHNYWIYALLGGCLISIYLARDTNPLAVYCLIFFAVPPFEARLPGFGVVNYLVEINHVRLLNLVVLLPLACRLLSERSERSSPLKLPGWLLAGYIVLLLALYAQGSTFTDTMRQGFNLFLDIWLPYYVFSRGVRSIAQVKEIITAFVLAVAVLAVIALFELGKSWLLYSYLDEAMGLHWGFGSYLSRGGDALRASGSTGQPIVLGYLMVVALALVLCLERDIRPHSMWWLAVVGLVVGLIASISRGPWIGAVAAVIVCVAVGKGAVKRLSWVVGGGVCLFTLVLVSPMGSTVIGYLPFVGDVDSFNVTYRQRLFDVSLSVLWQSPVFGVPDFLRHAAMQEMVQGDGIVDMVNTYLGVALASGLVGLSLFIGVFFVIAYQLLGAINAPDAEATDVAPLGRSLLAAIVGILVTIATTSSVSVIAPVYWVILGLSAAYVTQSERVLRIAANARLSARVTAADGWLRPAKRNL